MVVVVVVEVVEAALDANEMGAAIFAALLGRRCSWTRVARVVVYTR